VREAVQQVIDGVLNPLLQNDASSIELLDVTEEEVVVRVTGRAAFGVGAAIHIKKTIPTAKRRA
jgi:hypothetical protein